MFRGWRFFTGSLIIALAPLAGHAQTRPFDQQARNSPSYQLFGISARGRTNSAPAAAPVQNSPANQSWPQWSQDSQHRGEIRVNAQRLDAQLADIIYDPFVAQEVADPINGGNLHVHYQVPLVDDDDVFMEFKTGRFTNTIHWEKQTWNEKRLRWNANGQLTERWNFESDWKPVPFASKKIDSGPIWEPVFHPVVVGNFVYVPGFGGTIYKLHRGNGTVAARIDPFGGGRDENTFVAGPLSADSAGNVYYNAIKMTTGLPWDTDVVNSWLVKVAPDDTSARVTFRSLTHGAPAATDQCETQFDLRQLPFPPSPNAQVPTLPCGSQRPGINVAPAIAPDGTIYTVSRAHFNSRYGYVVAVNPDLSPKWIASLRDRLNDGCNVSIPPNGTPGGCRAGATTGVDPSTNNLPAGRVMDDSSASPTITPDGSVLYGAFSRYNYAQGHLFKFNSGGQFQASYDFGWDVTPAIYTPGTGYSIVIKDNRYGRGSYCNNPEFCPPDRTATTPNNPEAYFITQLDRNLNVEWKFKNTETKSCSRDANGVITCVDDHPNGFEWCVNAFAIDINGDVHANSEDGNVYAINQGGTLKQRIFLQLALGASYTPLSIGPDGKIYTQNFGHLFVIGNSNAAASNGRGVFKLTQPGK